jgi:hypothetical protein
MSELTNAQIGEKLIEHLTAQFGTDSPNSPMRIRWFNYFEYSIKGFKEERFFDKHLHNSLYTLMEQTLWYIWKGIEPGEVCPSETTGTPP